MHHTLGVFNTVDGLFVLLIGPTPPNPTELLSSKLFDTFIEKMKETNIIIFHELPQLSVSDAQVLSHKCDGTLLIVHSGFAKKKMY